MGTFLLASILTPLCFLAGFLPALGCILHRETTGRVKVHPDFYPTDCHHKQQSSPYYRWWVEARRMGTITIDRPNGTTSAWLTWKIPRSIGIDFVRKER